MSVQSATMKTIGLSNPEEIKNNPMNNSTSKMLYSFSKQKRFPRQNTMDLPYYELPNINTKRATSMGFGSKGLFNSFKQSPSPDKYNVVRNFDLKTKNGPSFGLGRNDIKASQTSIFTSRQVPGPGHYYPIQQIKKRSTSVRSRLPDHILDERIKVPGPGQYETDRSTIYGKMSNSKIESIRTARMCKETSTEKLRQKEIESQPAPWSYSFKVGTSRGDKILDETKGYKFGYSARKGLNVLPNSNPGPGQYNCFSEFSR